MKCLDCLIDDKLDRQAVGICRDCGAGLCERHVVVRRYHPERAQPVLGRRVSPASARLLRCTRCHGARMALDEDEGGVFEIPG